MKNKILTISIIFILISFIFINNVFAYSEEFEYNSNTYTFYIPDGAYNKIQELDLVAKENYYYFAAGANSQVYVYLFPSPVNCFLTKGTNNTDFDFSSFEGAYYIVLSESGSINSSLRTISSLQQSSAYGKMAERKFYYSSTVNIYTDSSCTDYFFQQPPEEIPEIPEETTPETTTLKLILEKVEMKEPIMTTIVGLAKLLIPLLICLIGFWKAWRLLSKTLYMD